MHFYLNSVLVLTFLGFFGFLEVGDCALPFGVFPLLTTGWYYKPSPVESVVLGSIVVKVLALRLAAITGLLPIPYHLNDLFTKNGVGKRSISHHHTSLDNLTMPHYPETHLRSNETSNNLTEHEVGSMFRVLLGLRRIDVNDCFLKTLCFTNERYQKGNGSVDDMQIIETLRFLSSVENNNRKLDKDKLSKSPIMDVYEKALMTTNGTGACEVKYPMCSLPEKSFRFQTILSDLF